METERELAKAFDAELKQAEKYAKNLALVFGIICLLGGFGLGLVVEQEMENQRIFVNSLVDGNRTCYDESGKEGYCRKLDLIDCASLEANQGIKTYNMSEWEP